MGVFAEQFCQKMNIAGISVSSNVFMAPLYGYTNAAFRLMVENLGAGIAFTEMVYVEDLIRRKKRALETSFFDEQEPVKALQLIGGNPSKFDELCKNKLLSHVDIIDINMGCAVPEIVKSGRGCALVYDLPRAAKIIEACKKGEKIVSVKCRPGMDPDENLIKPFVKMCEDAGVDLITVHGRPGNKMHDGPVRYDVIAEAKAHTHIPIIANGGIFSEEDAIITMQQTGANGVMLGRYGVKNPQIFSILTGS